MLFYMYLYKSTYIEHYKLLYNKIFNSIKNIENTEKQLNKISAFEGFASLLYPLTVINAEYPDVNVSDMIEQVISWINIKSDIIKDFKTVDLASIAVVLIRVYERNLILGKQYDKMDINKLKIQTEGKLDIYQIGINRIELTQYYNDSLIEREIELCFNNVKDCNNVCHGNNILHEIDFSITVDDPPLLNNRRFLETGIPRYANKIYDSLIDENVNVTTNQENYYRSMLYRLSNIQVDFKEKSAEYNYWDNNGMFKCTTLKSYIINKKNQNKR